MENETYLIERIQDHVENEFGDLDLVDETILDFDFGVDLNELPDAITKDSIPELKNHLMNRLQTLYDAIDVEVNAIIDSIEEYLDLEITITFEED